MGVEMSTPSTEPVGPTRSASWSDVCPTPQPTSITRSPARAAARSSAASPSGPISASIAALFATHFGPACLFQYSICSVFGPLASIMRLPWEGPDSRRLGALDCQAKIERKCAGALELGGTPRR
jgi:hypothetical protein